jgi:trimethylamine--corrinoid protein Co-methyltransferase
VPQGSTRRSPLLDLLSEEELEAICRGALFVLETTGMKLEHDRAWKLFAGSACRVEPEDTRVRIPPALVEECLLKCPAVIGAG